MWEWDFWKQYLDHMALNRYNLLTICSLHPYPSWIRVPDYPEVALENEYSPCNLDIVITRQKDYQR